MKTDNKKVIGIDARFYGPLGKGLGRYTQEIVDNIINKIDNPLKGKGVYKYVVFLSKENFKDFQTSNPNVKKILTNVRWYTLKEQLLMPFFILKEKVDLMHFPHFNVPIFCPTKFIVTIHDLILTKFPTPRASTLSPLLYKIKNFGYKIVILTAIKRSKKIITVSKFTQTDIAQQFNVPKNKIIVTYEGVAASITKEQSRDAQKVLLCYNIKKPFLLYVGNAYPHKNLERLIKNFIDIKNKYHELNLVLVGKEDYFYKRLKRYAHKICLGEKSLRDSIIFAGYVPDEDLKYFYQEALAYVFPSLYEGFGLPPLEAMSNGCPVISSNKASMPEILEEAALYFDPENDNEFKSIITKIINNKNLRERLITKGHEQIKKYNWLQCASQTFKLYQDILKD